MVEYGCTCKKSQYQSRISAKSQRNRAPAIDIEQCCMHLIYRSMRTRSIKACFPKPREQNSEEELNRRNEQSDEALTPSHFSLLLSCTRTHALLCGNPLRASLSKPVRQLSKTLQLTHQEIFSKAKIFCHTQKNNSACGINLISGTVLSG